MAKDNIYDSIISELILRLAAVDAATTTYLSISNSLSSQEVYAGFSGTVSFTSTVNNMPTGYSVSGTTHTLNYPVSPTQETSSSFTFGGSNVSVSLATIGDTFTVTSSVTLSHATLADISLTGTTTISATTPIYMGC